jgi:curli production assembly/transport component CsgG/holdfast attachment protein HfaB
MRAILVMLATALCAAGTGCASLNEFMNPSPTTRGSRVTETLRTIPAPDPAKVRTVTVYRFENKTGFPHGLAITNGMTDQLITALFKTGHFRVVERAVLRDLATEKKLQSSGAATGEAGATKLVGAQLIFAGAVTELDDVGGGGIGLDKWGVNVGAKVRTAQVGLDMRIVDAGTGEILGAIDVRRKVRKTGMRAGAWGVSGNVTISNAMDLAIRETLEEAVYELVMNFGAQ